MKNLTSYIPDSLKEIQYNQNLIPKIAKNEILMSDISHAILTIPTEHSLYNRDARIMDFLTPNSVHLALTSPPYWNLKSYNGGKDQLGVIKDYEIFLDELDKVWEQIYNSLVPGGRLICVVGDVCLSRRNNNGEHVVYPLHSSIQERARKIGFSNLSPIIWHKIANAKYEVEGNSRFLGKPYEPNGIIKNDIEYILMLRKPGGYRRPALEERLLSIIPDHLHKEWFQQIWNGITGASTKDHPAPYPLILAERLIKMFSFVNDTVIDPFMGSGTTNIAAAKNGRNSIGVEIDQIYFKKSLERLQKETSNLFTAVAIKKIA